MKVNAVILATFVCLCQWQFIKCSDLDEAVKNLMNQSISTMINDALRNEPVIKQIFLSYHDSKLHLGHVSSAGRYTKPYIDILPLRPGRNSYSTKQVLYYAPRYRDVHRSGLAIVALNLEKIFPCIAKKKILLSCRMFTSEEDGFMRGKAILEAGDRGNNFRMFGNGRRMAVYGFAVQGCKQLTSTCLPNWWEATVTCLLPRKYCSSS